MADMAAKGAALRRLTLWQWQVLLIAPVVFLLTWLRLRRGGYAGAVAAVRRPQHTNPPATPTATATATARLAQEIAYALAVAAKYGPWWPQCLVRSLALGWLLARKGVPFEIRIGAASAKPVFNAGGTVDFSAHAWVEHDGVVLNDAPDVATRFTPFDLPAGRS